MFDTHAHYDSGAFNADRHALLASMPSQGVSLILNPGCDVETSRQAVSFAKEYPFVYAAVGIHPSDCKGVTQDDLDAIAQLAVEEKVVAIGEIGLDYYWEDNAPKDFQQMVFRKQIELALKLDLPVIIHDREAHGDTCDIIKDYPTLRGVLHCFSGSAEMAKWLLNRGWYLGFDGPITYKNAVKAKEVVAVTPLERMLLETDSPYLTPVPFRGKRNDSSKLIYMAQTLAEWTGLDAQTIIDVTHGNGRELFRIED